MKMYVFSMLLLAFVLFCPGEARQNCDSSGDCHPMPDPEADVSTQVDPTTVQDLVRTNQDCPEGKVCSDSSSTTPLPTVSTSDPTTIKAGMPGAPGRNGCNAEDCTSSSSSSSSSSSTETTTEDQTSTTTKHQHSHPANNDESGNARSRATSPVVDNTTTIPSSSTDASTKSQNLISPSSSEGSTFTSFSSSESTSQISTSSERSTSNPTSSTAFNDFSTSTTPETSTKTVENSGEETKSTAKSSTLHTSDATSSAMKSSEGSTSSGTTSTSTPEPTSSASSTMTSVPTTSESTYTSPNTTSSGSTTTTTQETSSTPTTSELTSTSGNSTTTVMTSTSSSTSPAPTTSKSTSLSGNSSFMTSMSTSSSTMTSVPTTTEPYEQLWYTLPEGVEFPLTEDVVVYVCPGTKTSTTVSTTKSTSKTSSTKPTVPITTTMESTKSGSTSSTSTVVASGSTVSTTPENITSSVTTPTPLPPSVTVTETTSTAAETSTSRASTSSGTSTTTSDVKGTRGSTSSSGSSSTANSSSGSITSSSPSQTESTTEDSKESRGSTSSSSSGSTGGSTISGSSEFSTTVGEATHTTASSSTSTKPDSTGSSSQTESTISGSTKSSTTDSSSTGSTGSNGFDGVTPFEDTTIRTTTSDIKDGSTTYTDLPGSVKTTTSGTSSPRTTGSSVKETSFSTETESTETSSSDVATSSSVETSKATGSTGSQPAIGSSASTGSTGSTILPAESTASTNTGSTLASELRTTVSGATEISTEPRTTAINTEGSTASSQKESTSSTITKHTTVSGATAPVDSTSVPDSSVTVTTGSTTGSSEVSPTNPGQTSSIRSTAPKGSASTSSTQATFIGSTSGSLGTRRGTRTTDPTQISISTDELTSTSSNGATSGFGSTSKPVSASSSPTKTSYFDESTGRTTESTSSMISSSHGSSSKTESSTTAHSSSMTTGSSTSTERTTTDGVITGKTTIASSSSKSSTSMTSSPSSSSPDGASTIKTSSGSSDPISKGSTSPALTTVGSPGAAPVIESSGATVSGSESSSSLESSTTTAAKENEVTGSRTSRGSSSTPVKDSTTQETTSTVGSVSPTTSRSSSPTSSTTTTSGSSTKTTTDPLCSQQCPDGYLIGTSYCFILIPATSSRVNSYQSALSYCKKTDRQTLASLDKIRDNADIKLIQESAGLQSIDWIYANGIGGKEERFEKQAAVYSIYSQTLVSSPILMNVGISEVFGNISALCVIPQYCNSNECDVEKLFLAYSYYNNFKQTAGTLAPRRTGSITCLYGNQKTTTVTCNSLGAIYPNPTNIDCDEGATERQLKDTTNETVASCAACFQRGTKECETVIGSDGQTEGYRCICKEPYSMSRCWRTKNLCTPTICGTHGKCVSELAVMSCVCDWGYTGDHCETKLSEKFYKDIGYSTISGATITVGGLLFRAAKVSFIGFSKPAQGDDPQDTHQAYRSVLTIAAAIIMTLFSNPTLFGIQKAACRFYFIAIHYCYINAMLQWLFEGWNVNQVLRAVHLNEWEVDWHGKRSWGTRIVPRLVFSSAGVAAFLLIVFQTGWNDLAAEWTCVGVICQKTISIWLPIFAAVFILILCAGAVYESSCLILSRRPLLAYKIDMRIERQLRPDEAERVQKCRDNHLMPLVGLILLVLQWVAVILSSDHRDEPVYGYVTVIVAFIYSAFCSFQEAYTNPEDRSKYIELMMRFLPIRFAPNYNPITLWTIDEVKEKYQVPKAERTATYESFLCRNEELKIHHKWDMRLNYFLKENPEMEVDPALVEVFLEEMRHLKANGGTKRQEDEAKRLYKDYMDTVPHKDPREAGRLKGRLELVTLAAEDENGGVKLAKFFIVPDFHTFEPEIPERGVRRRKKHEKRLERELRADIYEMARAEAEEQARFVNSAILFWNYGNNVVR